MLTVSSQTGCRKTSLVIFSKAESKPKLAELRGAVVELSAGTYSLGAQNDARVICRCLCGPRTCKLSNANRCLQCCSTDMIAALLPLQPYKHCAAGILSEKNTLLWCNHIFFQRFANPVDSFLTMFSRPPIWKIFLKKPVRNTVWLRWNLSLSSLLCDCFQAFFSTKALTICL